MEAIPRRTRSCDTLSVVCAIAVDQAPSTAAKPHDHCPHARPPGFDLSDAAHILYPDYTRMPGRDAWPYPAPCAVPYARADAKKPRTRSALTRSLPDHHTSQVSFPIFLFRLPPIPPRCSQYPRVSSAMIVTVGVDKPPYFEIGFVLQKIYFSYGKACSAAHGSSLATTTFLSSYNRWRSIG